MRLQIDQASVSLGGKTILDHISLEVRGKDKIGIVGANGAGKTTLLHMICGRISPDTDDKHFHPGIWMARNTTIEILEQIPFFEKNCSVEEFIQSSCPVTDPYSRERYEFEVEYHKMFTGFGFDLEDRNKKIHDFSGGEQTKIALIRLLLIKPDIMVLDEPTNHLDLPMIHWLETYLKNYEKAVIVVSHDRFFLDYVTNIIYEVDSGKTKRYTGNYSSFIRQREEQHRILTRKYKEQQEEIHRLEGLIQRFKHKPKKASMARSKKKVLEKMDRILLPEQFQSYIYPGEIVPQRSGSKWVYECDKLRIGYQRSVPDKSIQGLHGSMPVEVWSSPAEMNLRIKRGQKIGIIGPNGSGKSTFLKTLAGIILPITGKLLPGTHLDVAYFDQFVSEINSKERVLEDFHQSYPSYDMSDCRKILARFLFRKEDVSKPVNALSGGEKSRYVLAKILESKPNVLLLDEPTNHLDIPSREILESAFSRFTGTILFITHDRYFLQQLADSLLIFEKDKVTYYPYSYTRFLEDRQRENDRKRQGIHHMEEENEALRRSLEEVPRKKKMQSASLSTEQSYWDWQLALATKEMEQAQRIYEMQLEQIIPDKPEGCVLNDEAETERKYTEACIRWFEIWQSYQEAFRSFQDN